MTFLQTFLALLRRVFRIDMTDSTKAALNTIYPTDKIVKVFQGSFTSPTDITTEVHTIGGIATNVYVYKIAHGFTRPVFCEMLSSYDGTTYVDSGVNTGSFIYSDSTYVYFLYGVGGVLTPDTRYYKILCSWIDDYDTTNPTIESFENLNKKTKLDSRLNYPKIYKQGVVTFSAGTAGSAETITIDHDLGTTANFKVFYEGMPNKVFPLNFGGVNNQFNIDDTENEMDAVISSTQLQMRAFKYGNNTFRAWYRIYIDS